MQPCQETFSSRYIQSSKNRFGYWDTSSHNCVICVCVRACVFQYGMSPQMLIRPVSPSFQRAGKHSLTLLPTWQNCAPWTRLSVFLLHRVYPAIKHKWSLITHGEARAACTSSHFPWLMLRNTDRHKKKQVMTRFLYYLERLKSDTLWDFYRFLGVCSETKSNQCLLSWIIPKCCWILNKGFYSITSWCWMCYELQIYIYIHIYSNVLIFWLSFV